MGTLDSLLIQIHNLLLPIEFEMIYTGVISRKISYSERIFNVVSLDLINLGILLLL